MGDDKFTINSVNVYEAGPLTYEFVENEGIITLYQYETEDCTGSKIIKTYECNECNFVDGEYVQAVCPQYDNSSYFTLLLLSLLLILLF